MSKWISSSDIESTMGHKILIAGLQEAGKTAIKRIFFLRQQAVDVNSLKATIDYERLAVRINNVPITVVDLGGQRIFIRRFLNSFSPFIFNSVKVFIFVIDVAVKSTRNNAVQYFTSALEKLREFSPNAEVYVFLHKNDLIRNSPNYESIHNQIKEEFQIAYDKKIKFFRTTIFDEKSIIHAFGRIFELTIPEASKSKLVDGLSIGSGEEFSDKFAMNKFNPEDEKLCPFCNITLFKTDTGYECNICGYTPVKTYQDREEDIVTKPKVSVDDLKAKLNAIKIPQSTTPEVSQFESNELEKAAVESTTNGHAVEDYLNIGNKDFDLNLPKILDLSFNRDEMEKTLSLGQKKFLNACINVKLPLELIRFILDEFIANYAPKKLNGSNKNILQAISYLKFGYLKDEDFLKFLYLSEYYTDLSVEDSLWNNFPYPFKEKYSGESEVELDLQALDEETFLLSFKENIGAKVNYNDYNAEVIFYKGKRRLGSINIPYDITEKDLKYMLVFELQFPIEKNLQGFVEETTSKILQEIKYDDHKAKIGEEPVDQVSEESKAMESEIIRLTENKDIFYKIIAKDGDFTIFFLKDEREFGKITGQNSISASGMFQLVRNETLIPTIIDDDELMFIVLEMFNNFTKHVK